MNCKNYREQLSPYADGMLHSGDRAALEAHIGSCPHCSAELAGLRKVIASYQALERPDAPNLIPGIHNKLDMARSGRHAAPAPSSLWSRVGLPAGTLAAAATALVVLAVSIPLYLKQTDSKRFERAARPDTKGEALFYEKRAKESELRKDAAVGKLPQAEPLMERTVPSKRLIQPAETRPAQAPAPSLAGEPGSPPKGSVQLKHFQGAPEQTMGPIRVLWSPPKPSEALLGLEIWLRTRPDTLSERHAGKLVVRLPQSNYPALLQEMERIGGPAVSSRPGGKAFFQSPHAPAGKQEVLDREAIGPNSESASVSLLTVEILLAPTK